MKKNITVNLCGRLYQIDEDAYELLNGYVESLHRYFDKQQGGEEIVDDIENRIAEHLDEQKALGRVLVTQSMVEDILHQVGDLKDLVGAEELNASTGGAEGKEQSGKAGVATGKKKKRKFYRDMTNKKLMGVLSGCAWYYGGTAKEWRWGFVLFGVLYMLILFVGSNVFGFGSFFNSFLSTIYALWASPSLLFLPLAYVLVGLFTPLAKTTEEMLIMQGREVNVQTLAEVQKEYNEAVKHDDTLTHGLKIIWGIMLLPIAFFLFLTALALIIFLVDSFLASDFITTEIFYREPEMNSAIAFAIRMICGTLLLPVLPLLYCIAHTILRSFGFVKPMSNKMRIIWLSVIGVGCVAAAVGITVGVSRWGKRQAELDEQRDEAYWKAYTHDGIVYNDQDWEFFSDNGWKLVDNEGYSRYTYTGQYMTGQGDVRYLDGHSFNLNAVYTAYRSDSLEAGVYRLSAAVRSNVPGHSIFLKCEDRMELATCGKRVKTASVAIPDNGNEGGNIHACLVNDGESDDTVVAHLVSRLSDNERRSILEANSRRGFGWNYVYIDSIAISSPAKVEYGVTNKLNRENFQPGWFSATDFLLERLK